MLQSGDGCDELTLVIGKGLQEARTNAISTAPKSAQLISHQFSKSSVRRQLRTPHSKLVGTLILMFFAQIIEGQLLNPSSLDLSLQTSQWHDPLIAHPITCYCQPRLKFYFAPLAQLAEQLTLNQRVAGSIPARCILRPAPVRRWCLVSPTWNASVPFLVRGSSADMNSVVTHFTENVSFLVIAAEFPG